VPAVAALAAALALLAPAAPASGQPVVTKHAVFRHDGDRMTVTTGFREMLVRSLRDRLRSGFATTVVMRVYLYEEEGAQPVSFAMRSLRAVYDLWQESYQLTIEEPGRTLYRRFTRQQDVVDRLTSLWRFPFAMLRDIRPGSRYFVAVVAEVNPMSDSVMAEVRRWLRNPQGSTQRIAGDSLFGSFVSIFVNENIRRADSTFRMRTQPFYRRP
jgi:hypothetical protein